MESANNPPERTLFELRFRYVPATEMPLIFAENADWQWRSRVRRPGVFQRSAGTQEWDSGSTSESCEFGGSLPVAVTLPIVCGSISHAAYAGRY